MTLEQIFVAIYLAVILPFSFGLSVWVRLQEKKGNYTFAFGGGPPTLLFGLFWPIFAVIAFALWIGIFCEKAADYTADKIAGEESPETLLRASEEQHLRSRDP